MELWRSDGTVAGTSLVKDIHPTGPSSPTSFVVLGSKVYFAANDGVNGRELWESDGTAAGTNLAEEVRPGSVSSSPMNMIAVGGTLFFVADDGLIGQELWSLTP